MRIFLIAVTTTLALPALSALAFTNAQEKASYNACLKFLAMNATQRAAVAKKAGYSLAQTTSACQLLKKEGLAEVEKLEKEYQEALRRQQEAPAPETDPYGGSDGGFAGPGVCTNGTCNGPGGVTVCTNGTCNGPDGVTVCTGGTCNGPGGVTVCTGGTCNGPNGVVVCTSGVCN